MKMPHCILFLTFLLCRKITYAQTDYFVQFKHLSDSLSNEYQIPSSVILAIAFQESGGGTSVVSRRLNNHFGLKGRVPGGDTVSIKSSYKYFSQPADSYIYFCNLVARKKFYPALKGNEDYKKWVIAIANTGYAGNAKVWTRYILNVIQKYSLEKN